MEIWWMVLTGLLALCTLVLLLRLTALRHSLREVAEELEEKLQTDTNTLISLSTGDRAAMAMAARINRQLRMLRKERLRLQNGDNALKAAVTNVSHDLRTPLTAICGYLDLLEQEPHSPRAKRYLAVIRERTDAMRTMTEELFRYSVVTAATDELNREPVCLNHVLERGLAGFTARCPPAVSRRRSSWRRRLLCGSWTPPRCGGSLTTFSATPPSIPMETWSSG